MLSSYRSSLVLTLVSLAACGPDDGGDPTPTSTPTVTSEFIWVATVSDDYSSGHLSRYDVSSDEADVDLADVTGDTSVWGIGDHLYVCARDWGTGNHNIQVFSYDLEEVGEIPVPDYGNPNDIEVIDGVGYISLFGAGSLLTFDVATLATTGTISLTSWADPDGNPDPAELTADGSHLLVALARIDYTNNYAPASPGYVISINTEDLNDVEEFTLAGTNPGALHVEGDYLWVASAGNLSAADGGLERVNLADGSTEVWASENDLSDSFFGSFGISGGKGWAWTDVGLTSIDLTTATINADYDLTGIPAGGVVVSPGGDLWLVAPDGLWAYDPTTQTSPQSEVVPVGEFSPYDITFLYATP